MKHLFLFLILLGCANSVILSAQTDTNYTRVRQCKSAVTSIENCPPNDLIETITYIDEAGRKDQIQTSNATTDNKTIVKFFEYDQYGRLTKDFLPLPTSSTDNNYKSQLSIGKGNIMFYDDSYPYSEYKYESSPIKNIEKISAPGTDWKMNSGHEVKFENSFNINTDQSIIKFSVYGSDLQYNGFYAKGTLVKKVVKNEDWKLADGNVRTIQSFFTDEGVKILDRKFLTNTETIDTYYIYDYLGNLRFVLSPELSKLFKNGLPANYKSLLNNLGYQYTYDSKYRLIERKDPSKSKSYYVYDKLNRVVATQDSVMSAKNVWLFTKYDKFGTAVYTGNYQSSISRQNLQNTYDSQTNLFEERTTSSFSNNGMQNIYYTNRVFPTTNLTITAISYYSNYTVPQNKLPSTVEGKTIAYGNSQELKGLQTEIYTNILGTTNWESVVYLYEKDYLIPVAVYQTNSETGFTKIENKLNNYLQVTQTKTFHKKNSSAQEIITQENFAYDRMGRLTQNAHKVDNNSQETIGTYTYDKIGRLLKKDVGQNLQSVDYKYNIRNWLTDINNIDDNSTDDIFAFRIGYNKIQNPSFSAKFDGNIYETRWRTTNYDTIRTYNYLYDNINRLTQAVSTKGNLLSPLYVGNYNEEISYDLNGNIKSLKRKGDLDESITPYTIDHLTYIYKQNSNLLLNVNDSGDKIKGFPDGNINTNTGQDDYEYDKNGNLVIDRNKKIQIEYNDLNLPSKITHTSGTVEYTYNSLGTKIRKTVKAAGKTIITDYVNGYQYVDNKLQFFNTSEGYVSVNVMNGIQTYNYIYQYKDHVGNVRVSYTKGENNNIRIIDDNHYYPYGLLHTGYSKKMVDTSGKVNIGDYKGYNNNHYGFNGTELQKDFNINLNAMDFRMYDPAIGRWQAQDPIVHHSMSPYNSFDNNPVFWSDPSGADSEDWDDTYWGDDGYAADGGGCDCNNWNWLNDISKFLKNVFEDSLDILNGLGSVLGDLPTNDNPEWSYEDFRNDEGLNIDDRNNESENPPIRYYDKDGNFIYDDGSLTDHRIVYLPYTSIDNIKKNPLTNQYDFNLLNPMAFNDVKWGPSNAYVLNNILKDLSTQARINLRNLLNNSFSFNFYITKIPDDIKEKGGYASENYYLKGVFNNPDKVRSKLSANAFSNYYSNIIGFNVTNWKISRQYGNNYHYLVLTLYHERLHQLGYPHGSIMRSLIESHPSFIYASDYDYSDEN
ncbi:DUF6443 domain-containing protein [Empedobacter brevis]|uniref:DUF6443 domain-containing protein n=1 Tax=Empedobacter brevis TaxID=247 RepID=UPI0028D5234F|nr:DUF6443 domain-containing protein [Empedobacter brevis]